MTRTIGMTMNAAIDSTMASARMPSAGSRRNIVIVARYQGGDRRQCRSPMCSRSSDTNRVRANGVAGEPADRPYSALPTAVRPLPTRLDADGRLPLLQQAILVVGGPLAIIVDDLDLVERGGARG